MLQLGCYLNFLSVRLHFFFFFSDCEQTCPLSCPLWLSIFLANEQWQVIAIISSDIRLCCGPWWQLLINSSNYQCILNPFFYACPYFTTLSQLSQQPKESLYWSFPFQIHNLIMSLFSQLNMTNVITYCPPPLCLLLSLSEPVIFANYNKLHIKFSETILRNISYNWGFAAKEVFLSF